MYEYMKNHIINKSRFCYRDAPKLLISSGPTQEKYSQTLSKTIIFRPPPTSSELFLDTLPNLSENIPKPLPNTSQHVPTITKK